MPVAAVVDPVVEDATEPAAVEEQATTVEDVEAQSPESFQSPPKAMFEIDLKDMTSLDLAVLITARHRTLRQALKAVALLAARHEWYHLGECADMLCRSYDPAEQRLGLHLVRRYQAADPTMRHALIGPVRYLALSADTRVASQAQGALDDMTDGG